MLTSIVNCTKNRQPNSYSGVTRPRRLSSKV